MKSYNLIISYKIEIFLKKYINKFLLIFKNMIFLYLLIDFQSMNCTLIKIIRF